MSLHSYFVLPLWGCAVFNIALYWAVNYLQVPLLQYNMILHTVLLHKMKQNINHGLHSQKTIHTLPKEWAMGCLFWGFGRKWPCYNGSVLYIGLYHTCFGSLGSFTREKDKHCSWSSHVIDFHENVEVRVIKWIALEDTSAFIYTGLSYL